MTGGGVGPGGRVGGWDGQFGDQCDHRCVVDTDGGVDPLGKERLDHLDPAEEDGIVQCVEALVIVGLVKIEVRRLPARTGHSMSLRVTVCM